MTIYRGQTALLWHRLRHKLPPSLQSPPQVHRTLPSCHSGHVTLDYHAVIQESPGVEAAPKDVVNARIKSAGPSGRYNSNADVANGRAGNIGSIGSVDG